MDRRKHHTFENGLTAWIRFATSYHDPRDPMHEIEVEPIEGEWVHLMNEEAYAKFLADGNRYHISICFESDFENHERRDELRDELHQLAHDWGRWSKYTFHGYLCANAYIELPESDHVYKDIEKLHSIGSYKDRRPHISF